jgi:hypothetical protein
MLVAHGVKTSGSPIIDIVISYGKKEKAAMKKCFVSQ